MAIACGASVAQQDTNLMQMEPAMKHSLAVMMVVLLTGTSLMLSACGRGFEPGTSVFHPGAPVLEPSQPYGSVDLVGWQ
jgi:hypothetical protein